VARSEASERQRWIVETMSIEPDDRVLELGCGHGVAVSLICERLTEGVVVALDQSQKMIDAAVRRNAEHVEAGRASFLCVAVADADLDRMRFDKVLAIHLPVLLRGDPARELAVVKRHLTPDGRLYVGWQALGSSDAGDTAGRLADVLREHGFAIDSIETGSLGGRDVFCVIARQNAA
jgi:SAM-dependent methyltransferase